MYVCVCRGVREREVRAAVRGGATSVGQLCRTLGLAPRCAKCLPMVREILKEERGSAEPTEGTEPAPCTVEGAA